MGLVRLVVYRNKPTTAVVSFTDPTGNQRTESLESKPTIALISPPMRQSDFSLKAEQDGETIGEAHGFFRDEELILTKHTGAFSEFPPSKIIERETLRAFPFRECPGLARTEIAVLSRRWQGETLMPHAQEMEWWSDAGLRKVSDTGRKGVTGFSLEDGGVVTDCHVALAAVLSGPFEGKSGWLLWGGNAGVLSGKITAGIWYPSLKSFPKKAQGKLLFMPDSVMAASRVSRQDTDGIVLR
jgi:hypothetical protein